MRNLVYINPDVVVGKKWIEIRDKIIEFIKSGIYLITIIGRPGTGKTHIVQNVLRKLAREYLYVYLDLTLLEDKNFTNVISSIAQNSQIVNLIKYMKCSRNDKNCKYLQSILSNYGVRGIQDYAMSKPIEFLQEIVRFCKIRGLNGFIITLDEGAISSDDPMIMKYIKTLHAFRNICAKINGLYVINTMLPDVLNYISKVDTPLMDILRLGIISLPDYVDFEDIDEFSKVIECKDKCVEEVKKLFDKYPPLTVRQLICLLQNCDKPELCGISIEEIEISID